MNIFALNLLILVKPHCDSLTTYKFNFPLGLAFLLQLTSIYFLDLIRLIFMATQKANKKLHQSENYFAVKRIKESSLFVYSGSMTSFQLLFRDLYGIIWAGKTYAKVEAIYSLFTATHLKARERLKWVYGIEIELPARKKRNGAKRKESKSARKRRKKLLKFHQSLFCRKCCLNFAYRFVWCGFDFHRRQIDPQIELQDSIKL